jgi:hypothetical protein
MWFYWSFIILRWSFNYESNVFRYNKILIDWVFGNSKSVVPSTLTIDLGFASVNSQCLGDNKFAIPSYPVNKYILLYNHDHDALLPSISLWKANHECKIISKFQIMNWSVWDKEKLQLQSNLPLGVKPPIHQKSINLNLERPF